MLTSEDAREKKRDSEGVKNENIDSVNSLSTKNNVPL